MRTRLDHFLVESGFFESRAQAVAAIAAGLVSVDGVPARKPAQMISGAEAIQAEKPHPYVSRGALKLAAALDHAGWDVAGCVALDLGASTGGFTDLLRRRGARRIYAVDVGRGQLHASLREDAAIVNLEACDARDLGPDLVPEAINLLVADLSFIGLAKALPPGLALVRPGGRIVLLVKPQFEAGPGAGKKGVIRDPALHAEVLGRVEAEIAALGVAIAARLASPIAGGDGNTEFLLIGTKTASTGDAA